MPVGWEKQDKQEQCILLEWPTLRESMDMKLDSIFKDFSATYHF